MSRGSQFLEYEWISSKGAEMGRSCRLVHQGPCSLQFLTKLLVVSKLGLKYYLPFHLFPLLLRLRQAKHPQQVLQMVLKRLYYYTKSVLFMAILVAVTKGALCFGSSRVDRMNGWLLVGNSVVAPLGILLEEGSRQREIGYFVLAKAARSIYLIFKRKGSIHIPHEQQWMHMVLMALLFYFYCQHPSTLKLRSVFDELWGVA